MQQREATRMAAFQPQEELNRFADITTGIMGGMRGTGTTTTNIPNPTPLQTALGVGTTLAGIYGGLTGKLTGNFNFNNIMNRTLKRPMFRIGGSAGTGITSGLDQPRKRT